MEKIRITKEFKFEMAHALHGYDGLCANIHSILSIIYCPPNSILQMKKLFQIKLLLITPHFLATKR